MKRLAACLLALALLAMPALAQESDQLLEMEAPVAGLLACLMGGSAYPEDRVDNEFALQYVFAMANIYYADSAEPAPEDGAFALRAQLDDEEVDLWLTWAFGDRFGLNDLVPDQVRLGEGEGGYWAGIGDGYALTVTCAGDGLAQVPFDYALSTDGAQRVGQVIASFEERSDQDAPLCVIGLWAQAGDLDYLGNWRSEDGYWFSLMDEGLIFLFDPQSQLIGQGTYVLQDGALSIDLGGQALSGQVADGAVTLRVAGADKRFCRETYA